MRDCENCIYHTENGCSKWECKGTVTLDDYKSQIRADALDEFINNVSESIIWDILAEIMKRNINASEGSDRIIEYLQKIAEKLKEQKND